MAYQKSDGMNYAPESKGRPVVKPGEFVFAATALDHGHIYGMCNGLFGAGAVCRGVYDPDPKKLAAFHDRYPDVPMASSLEELLEDSSVQMIAAAAIPNLRCDLGIRIMEAGKDYFTDKAPLTTLDQLARAKAAVERTGRKYMVYYSERLHVESAVAAGQMIEDGAVGQVIQVLNLAPHRLNAPSRPDWFWSQEQSGGTLCDIGSHQIEQFLHFTKNTSATILSAQRANYDHPEHPEFDDFAAATLLGGNGATQYLRVDWFNPDGLSTWGDGRLFILGTKGYMEVRKYLDVARDCVGDQIYYVDGQGEHHECVAGKSGFPFFGEMILDCLNRTEHAMTQEHIFLAAELGVRAQNEAIRIQPRADERRAPYVSSI
ncbi:MAG: Gfo/Idh/MocA family oxidoreductase [Clostridia bacterium]|nr:Gfo/Idh/MocA family oxidoreductase [Clostridia bacterium]